MATETLDATNRAKVAWIVLGAFALGFVVLIVLALRTPPQLTADEEVFKTVDALYTAVRMKDEKRLGECEQRLNAYRDAGKLPKESAEVLAGVIAKARAGSWETATERLYDFMLAQRREGAAEQPPKREKAKPAKSKL
ncbi:MAG: hypothetical protein K8U57_25820 [Planctomycetes bacterium]|nr:hypothetical protein [Planctomycetota bacterium]